MKRLVLKIETVPIAKEELTAEESDEAALDGLSGRVVCVGYIVLDEFAATNTGACVALDEKEVLDFFWSLVARESVKGFVGRDGVGLDLSLLWKRSEVNQVRRTLSQDALTDFVGVEARSAGEADVLGWWCEGKQREIASFCLEDCWATYECYCRMNSVKATKRFMVEETLWVDLGVRRGS